MRNTDVTKYPKPNPEAREGLVVPHLIQQSNELFTYPSPIKVLSVLEERKKLTQKGNNPLAFEEWIFCSGQPVRNDDLITP